MSSDEEMPHEEESHNEDLQLAFVIMLEDYQIILDKKMTPAVKSAKDKALKELTEIYNKNTKQSLDIKQVLKKVNNMKSKIKKITDLKKTGNKKIKLNEWQQRFYDIWSGNDNPVIQRVPGGVTAGISRDENADLDEQPSTSREETNDNNDPIEQLQRKLLIKQINAAIAQEKAAIAQEKAAFAVEKAAGMDSKKFYGHMASVIIPDLESDESELSDEGEIVDLGRVLVPESDSEELPTQDDAEDIEIPETDFSSDSSDDNIPLSEIKKQFQKKASNKPDWKDGNLIKTIEEQKFSGCDDLPPSIRELETPVQFFKFLFPNNLLEHITEQTNIYSVQTRINKPANISQYEMEQFIGIAIYMSIIQLPSTRHYWNNDVGHPAVSSVMSCNRFEEVKRFLHFNNNDDIITDKSHPGYDKLFKIRPLLNMLRERLRLVPKEEFLAVDEQIIPTKARTQLKQYNPKKPHKWGYKNFVLSGVSGFSYDFDLFAGSQSNTVPTGAPNLSMSSNVVLKLSESIPRHKNYKLFFDNWFTSVGLMTYLTTQGILPLGTVRLNRVPGLKMPLEKEMKKKGRGYMVEKTANIDSTDISVVSWFDNKIVTTISTFVGSQPVGEKKRFFKKRKLSQNDTVSCEYMACVNSWLLSRRANKIDLPLLDFKLAIADALFSNKITSIREERDLQKKYLRKIFAQMVWIIFHCGRKHQDQDAMEQIKTKFSKLKQNYMKVKDNNAQAGASSMDFAWTDEFDSIFSHDHDVVPIATASSLKCHIPPLTLQHSDNENIIPKKTVKSGTEKVISTIETLHRDRLARQEQKDAKRREERQELLNALRTSNEVYRKLLEKLDEP
ncbi:hypothetical protein NQ315_014719 [Exocentrus adspersus]|uniref:PiggyBac transposable element-derived protein domain-containing protein n=1 Tax=Exocentrus adspersus TaxID=1586481 RepID=A0AAV8VEA9_9CUCU|nr:hypothetical protein NQ315_014719 [Exocentrus adspersus]